MISKGSNGELVIVTDIDSEHVQELQRSIMLCVQASLKNPNVGDKQYREALHWLIELGLNLHHDEDVEPVTNAA
jgi:hypothetical protein